MNIKRIYVTAIAALSLLTFSNLIIANHIEPIADTEGIMLPDPAKMELPLTIPEPGDDGEATIDEADATVDRLTDYAAKFLGTRYVWGATGPKSFDCSGFIGYVYRNEGIHLPRTSAMQYSQGVKVSKDELRPGDLLFFSSRRSGKGRVGHVAMVTDVNPDGSCTFIHASTKKGVVYQKFPDGGYYSRCFVGAKRIVDSDPS